MLRARVRLMEGTPQPGGIRRGPQGGDIQGWGGHLEAAERLKPLQGWGVTAGGGTGLPPGSSNPSRLRMGGNAASRLTLTITLGEEKAFGCDELFSPGPWSGGGGGFAPSSIFMLLTECGWLGLR